MKKPLIVILAGGKGTSFGPIITNKTLVPFLGKPILQHTIEMAESAGFNNALIITNQENEAWLSTYQPFNITLRTKIVAPTGMGDAIIQAQNEIGEDPIIVINSCDIINSSYLKEFYQFAKDTYSCVTGLEISNYFPGGYLKTKDVLAIDIIEKPGAGNEPSNLLNLVIHYFSNPKEFIYTLKNEETSDSQYENALKKLMTQSKVSIAKYKGPWSKLKYSFHILDVMATLLNMKVKNHIARSAKISHLASIEGPVYIDEGAKIDSFTVIKGPSYIGKNVRIGNHCLVRESVIEKNSIVGFGSEVARSYIGPNCMLHHNYVGDTVLEGNINPSWGTTFANRRIDNKPITMHLKDKKIATNKQKFGAVVSQGAFFGVNCSVMPGTTIEQNAKILPNLTVSGKQEAISGKQ
jgi:bifunctional UDP-N-acetylglucosamine pyrophosphorylase/glucosamine-1-phosphate N-acetyltransferase